ncbi:MAG TPA: MBL fold metallo-hydrolase [Polyangiaceae bacterium]|nr:MBL fold metallo-hydrolase [Polyangiaceae bacterium]
MEIKSFFDERTSTLTYVVYDPSTLDAIVLDPVMDYDPASGAISHQSVTQVVEFLNQHHLKLHYVLETHAHADHLSGSQLLKEACPNVKVAIGRRITEVQATFRDVFALGPEFPIDGTQFDRLLDDGEILEAGSIQVRTLFTPGHTPACASYLIDDALFTGDAVFMPDSGVGRCDFPGGSAKALYSSVQQRLYELPDETRIFVGHDYQPGGRELRYQTTVGEQKRSNALLRADTSEESFVSMREKRDATLPAPKLLFQSVQVNIHAGRLPAPINGIRYLKMPLDAFRPPPPSPKLELETCERPIPSGRQG